MSDASNVIHLNDFCMLHLHVVYCSRIFRKCLSQETELLTITKCLVVKTSNPLVDNIKDGLIFEESSCAYSNKSHHSHASVHHFSLFSKTGFHLGDESIRLGVLSSFVHFSLIRVEKKGIRKGQRADGGSKTNHEGVKVSDQDDSTFIGNGVLSRDGSKGSPLLKVENGISIRDKSVSLSVRSCADEEPSEHSMTAVPLFSLYRRSPSPLRELGVFSLPVSYCFIEVSSNIREKVEGGVAIRIDLRLN